MKDAIEHIRHEVIEHCQDKEKAELRDSLDEAGSGKLEWESSLILEVRTRIEGIEEGTNSFTQAVPVQFTLSFEPATQHITVYLQWGKVDTAIWQAAEPVIIERLADQGDKHVAFFSDREVVELHIVYPIHEFDFEYVYEETVTYFGLINSIFFEKVQESNSRNKQS